MCEPDFLSYHLERRSFEELGLRIEYVATGPGYDCASNGSNRVRVNVLLLLAVAVKYRL